MKNTPITALNMSTLMNSAVNVLQLHGQDVDYNLHLHVEPDGPYFRTPNNGVVFSHLAIISVQWLTPKRGLLREKYLVFGLGFKVGVQLPLSNNMPYTRTSKWWLISKKGLDTLEEATACITTNVKEDKEN